MSKYKKVYAVIDNYHENRFPVIAVCNTEDAAEKYIADRIKEDKQKGNNYDYDFIEIDKEAETVWRSHGRAKRYFATRRTAEKQKQTPVKLHGCKNVTKRQPRGDRRGYAYTRPNRYDHVSRLHFRKSRNTIYQRAC